MSKAFTKEDSSPEQPAVQPMDWVLAGTGGKLYLTPAGFKRLSAELDTARSSKNQDLQLIRTLEHLVQISEVIDPSAQSSDEARFGATVTVRDESHSTRTYCIVGTFEAESKTGKISYLSPMAKALLGKKAGDEVIVQTPTGDEELEIVSVAYVPIED